MRTSLCILVLMGLLLVAACSDTRPWQPGYEQASTSGAAPTQHEPALRDFDQRGEASWRSMSSDATFALIRKVEALTPLENLRVLRSARHSSASWDLEVRQGDNADLATAFREIAMTYANSDLAEGTWLDELSVNKEAIVISLCTTNRWSSPFVARKFLEALEESPSASYGHYTQQEVSYGDKAVQYVYRYHLTRPTTPVEVAAEAEEEGAPDFELRWAPDGVELSHPYQDSNRVTKDLEKRKRARNNSQ